MSTNPIKPAIILSIGQGNFNDGFPLSLTIRRESQIAYEQKNLCHAPGFSEIPQLYQDFSDLYRQMGGMAALALVPGQTNHESLIVDCQTALENLRSCLKRWFRDQSFKFIKSQVISYLSPNNIDESIPVIIDVDEINSEANIILLRKLPWHLWDLFSTFKTAELVLNLQKSYSPIQPLVSSDKVLAVFGDNTGLTIQEDLEAIKRLLGENNFEFFPSNIDEISQPGEAFTNPSYLINLAELRQGLQRKLRNSLCKILFFSGHSNSISNYTSGALQIASGAIVTLGEIELALEKALTNGLKLAIFNSCDGLGIAIQLASLNQPMPTIIVMREPVPDIVARSFWKFFLEEFSQGKPLYQAVREARENLEFLECGGVDHAPCPGATWLPVICQNLNQQELVWNRTPDPSTPKKLLNPGRIRRLSRLHKFLISMMVAAVLAVLLFSVGPRDIFRNFRHAVSTVRDYIIPKHSIGDSNKESWSSLGDKSFITQEVFRADESYKKCTDNIGLKQSGTGSLAGTNRGTINDGIQNLKKYLGENLSEEKQATDACPSDPEARIYLSNAQALEKISANYLNDFKLDDSDPSNSFLAVSNRLIKEGKLLRIAVVVPVGKGKNSTVGTALEILRGVAQAQYEINEAGGIGDSSTKRFLQIQIVNETSTNQPIPDKTKEVAKALSVDPAILAVVGHYTSTSVKEASSFYQEGKLILVSPTSTASRSQSFQLNDWVFRVASTDQKAAKDLAQYLSKTNIKKLGIAYSETDYGRSLQTQVRLELPSYIITPDTPDSCSLDSGDSDTFSAQTDTFSAEDCMNDFRDIDGILLIPSNQITEKSNAVKLIKENNRIKKLPMFGGDAVYGGVTLGNLQSEAGEMVVAIPWHYSTGENMMNPSFKTRLLDLWELRIDGINWRTMMAYDAAQALVQGLQDLKDDSPTREALKQALSNVNAKGFMGDESVSFKDDNDRNISKSPASKLGTVVQVKCPETTRCGFEKPSILNQFP
jgi:branched-chain amino acid transport system substrate-binding protein